jgi:hypothetical protein
LGNKLLPEYDYIVKESCNDWVLSIDIDEFLILKDHNTIHDFVIDKLLINNNINLFQFRWVIMEKYDNLNLNFNESLKKYKTFKSSVIKSMAKITDVYKISYPHDFHFNKQKTIFIEDKILSFNKDKLSYVTLRKIDDDKYKNYILHIKTRSIDNLLLKSLETQLCSIFCNGKSYEFDKFKKNIKISNQN